MADIAFYPLFRCDMPKYKIYRKKKNKVNKSELSTLYCQMSKCGFDPCFFITRPPLVKAYLSKCAIDLLFSSYQTTFTSFFSVVMSCLKSLFRGLVSAGRLTLFYLI